MTKDQEEKESPLNKNTSDETPKMNRGVELLLRNKRRKLPEPKTFQVKWGNMIAFFNREIHFYFEFHSQSQTKLMSLIVYQDQFYFE